MINDTKEYFWIDRYVSSYDRDWMNTITSSTIIQRTQLCTNVIKNRYRTSSFKSKRKRKPSDIWSLSLSIQWETETVRPVLVGWSASSWMNPQWSRTLAVLERDTVRQLLSVGFHSWLTLGNFLFHFHIMFWVCPFLSVRDNLQRMVAILPPLNALIHFGLRCNTISRRVEAHGSWVVFDAQRPSRTALVRRETTGSTQEFAVLISPQRYSISEFVAIRVPRIEVPLLRFWVLLILLKFISRLNDRQKYEQNCIFPWLRVLLIEPEFLAELRLCTDSQLTSEVQQLLHLPRWR